MNKESLTEIVSRIQKSTSIREKEEATTSFFYFMCPILMKWARRYGTDAQTSDDIVMTAIQRIYDRVCNGTFVYENDAQILAYFKITLRSIFIDILRKNQSTTELSESLSYKVEFDERLIANDLMASVNRYLDDKISETDRVIFRSRAVVGLSIKEISQMVDIPAEEVSRIYYRVKMGLREYLSSEDDKATLPIELKGM